MIVQGDAARLPLPDKSVDLVFGSPPYGDARTYGIGADRSAEEWVDWMLVCTREACRVSRGLVLWVAAGVTRKWRYRPYVEGLLWEWYKKGGTCWRPAYWHRAGIPGSGGKQWLRADVEYVLAFTDCAGPIPWADNLTNGAAPKFRPGGAMSHRTKSGARMGNLKRKAVYGGRGERISTTKRRKSYEPPTVANPGNLIRGIPVGWGIIGSRLAHENEAPFPERLAEWFIRGWCPEGGIVLDPFSGSGTTAVVAARLGRVGIGLDVRASQCELGVRRFKESQRYPAFW